MRYDVMMDSDESLVRDVEVAMIHVVTDSPDLEKFYRDELL